MSALSHPTAASRVIPIVVQLHAEESAMLRHVRSVLVRAPQVRLLQLQRLDERIAAHLDGLSVAGAYGTERCVAALETPGVGEVFTLAVRALEDRDSRAWHHVLALVPALPAARRGAASALGWVSPVTLQGVVRELLGARTTHERELGLSACRMHGVDPGQALTAALGDADAGLRAAALRCAGELGRLGLLDAARAAITDDQPEVVFWAAWAACLLGDRHASLQVLGAAAQQTSPLAPRALALALLASPFEQARELARRLSAAGSGPVRARRALRVIGLLGDARFLPWLIENMQEPATMRLAGESFSWITGADLARQDLETLTPPLLPEHPSDDPEDEDVSLDEDDSLPWPDVDRLHAWWQAQAGLQAAAAAGTRLFAGSPCGMAVADEVLREGSQRMRSLAALWQCVLQPGRPLFQVAAPARRQRRWLAATGPS